MSNLDPISKSRLDKAREALRLFLMDTEELNRLLRRKEIDDRRLDLAIQLAISKWNSTTPLLASVSIGNFPSLYLLIHLAAVQCLKMAGLYQSRNELTYSSGGSSFIRSNKTAYYQSWIQNFSSEAESMMLNMKIQQNVATGYSGFHSEYSIIGYDW